MHTMRISIKFAFFILALVVGLIFRSIEYTGVEKINQETIDILENFSEGEVWNAVERVKSIEERNKKLLAE